MILSLARLRISAFLIAIGLPGILAATSAPGITIKSANVAIDDQGTASTQFTVTSNNGFAGQVGVYCQGPNPNLLPFAVLPQCSHPTQYVDVPAGGSASGTISFYPPWVTPQTASRSRLPRHPASSVPLMASIFLGLGLLRLRFRKSLPLNVLVAAACLSFVAGISGCVQSGGNAMTPGNYTFTINGATVPGATPAASANSTFSVTVRCNSC